MGLRGGGVVKRFLPYRDCKSQVSITQTILAVLLAHQYTKSLKSYD